MTSTISVTADHIARGTRQDAEHCPVALAVKDLLPGFAHISVDDDCIVMRRDDGSPGIIFDSPPEVQAFTYAYDDGEDIDPFTFELDEDFPAAAS